MADNLLTANQASVETDLTGLQAEDYCTIARSTAQAAHGTACVAMTCTATTNPWMSVRTGQIGTGAVAVTVGNTYTATASFRAATTARGTELGIAWFTSGGGFIGKANAFPGSDTTTGWLTGTVTGVAPATAAFATVIPTVQSPIVGEVHYADKFGLWQGTDTFWSMPGASGSFGTALWPRDLQYQLNRLAGTLVSDRPQLSEQGAANVWAAIPGRNLGLQGALNIKAGRTNPSTFLSVRAVCNELGGTVNQDMAYALSKI